MRVLDRLVQNCGLGCCTIAMVDGTERLVIARSDVLNFVLGLRSYVDVSWVSASARSRFFNYDLVSQHWLLTAPSGAEMYDAKVLLGALDLLGVQGSEYDGRSCLEAIASHHGFSGDLGLASAQSALAASSSAGASEAAMGADAVVVMDSSAAEAAEGLAAAHGTSCQSCAENIAKVKHLQRTVERQSSSIRQLRTLHSAKTKVIKSLKRQLKCREQHLSATKRPKKTEAVKTTWLHRGKKGRYFTYEGGFNLVCRRVASNCAAYSLGCAAAVDVHSKTITRYEVALRAAGVAFHRAVFFESQKAMREHQFSEDPGFLFRLNLVRGDATNAQVWQNSKLHVVEHTVVFTGGVVHEGTDFEDMWKELRTNRCLGDLQVVKDSTAAGTLGIVTKAIGHMTGEEPPWSPLSDQQRTVAARGALALGGPELPPPHLELEDAEVAGPMATEEDVESEAPGAAAPREEGGPQHTEASAGTLALVSQLHNDPSEPNLRSIDNYLTTTDSGPDESQSRKMLKQQLAPLLTHLWWECDCFAHIYQLIVKSQLKHIDQIVAGVWKRPWGYVSVLSKVMLLWRENARAMFSSWQLMFPDTALKCAKLVPPKCIVGRWGSISRCEAYLRKCDIGELTAVLDVALAKYDTAAANQRRVLKRPAGAAAPAQPDIPEHANAEEQMEYSNRMGRWRLDVFKAFEDPAFFVILRIAHKSRESLDHFVHFLAKKRKDCEPLGLARLVFYKAKSLLSDLESMADISSENGPWSEILSETPADLVGLAKYTISTICMRNTADFQRRVVEPMSTYPLKALKLAKHDPVIACPERQEVCSELLAMEKQQGADPTMNKLVILFRDALLRGKRDGALLGHESLYLMMRLIACKWVPDVQGIEGLNSLIKLQCQRYRRLALPTLDARLALTTALGLGARKVRHGWKDVAPKIKVLVDIALFHVPDIDTVLSLPNRWASPAALPGIPQWKGPEPLADIHSKPALEWAKLNTTRFARWYRQEFVSKGLLGVVLVDDTDSWICPLLFRDRAFFVKALIAPGTHVTSVGCLKSAQDVFAAQHDKYLSRACANVPLAIAPLSFGPSPVTLGETTALQPLEYIKAKPRPKKRSTEMQVVLDGDPGGDGADDGAEDGAISLHGDDSEPDPEGDQDVHMQTLGCAEASFRHECNAAIKALTNEDFNKAWATVMGELYGDDAGDAPALAEANIDPSELSLDLGVAHSLMQALPQLPQPARLPSDASGAAPTPGMEALSEHGEDAEELGDDRAEPGDVPRDSLDPKVALWLQELAESLRALSARAAQLEAEVPLGTYNRLSLVLATGDMDPLHKRVLRIQAKLHQHLTLVKWTNPSARIGRPIRLDGGCAVWSVPAAIKEKSFAGATVVLPDAGTAVEKLVRMKVSKAALRLKSMWGAAIFTQTEVQCNVEVDPCSFCNVAEARDGLADVMRCPLCLQVSHPECCLLFKNRLEVNLVDTAKAWLCELGLGDLHGSVLPEMFAVNSFCAFCQAWCHGTLLGCVGDSLVGLKRKLETSNNELGCS